MPKIGYLPVDARRFENSLHPTGRLIFQDDFADLRWSADAGTVAIDAATPESYLFHNATNALKLTTGAVAGNTADAFKTIPYFDAEKIALEIIFGIDSDPAALDYLSFSLYMWDGTNRYEGAITYKRATTLLQYVEAGGTWATLDTIALDRYVPYHLKSIVNLRTKTYEKTVFCGRTYTAHKGKAVEGPSADASAKKLRIHLIVCTVGAAASYIYVGDVRFTDES